MVGEILKRLKEEVEDAKDDFDYTGKRDDFYRGFYKGIRFAYDIVKGMGENEK